jgi:hypothetical protein
MLWVSVLCSCLFKVFISRKGVYSRRIWGKDAEKVKGLDAMCYLEKEGVSFLLID